jgi:hypothetical protein
MKLTKKEMKQRQDTIALLNPEVVQEMRNCAEAIEMDFDQFMEVLNRAAEDPDYYESMGDNESYGDYDWNKIWDGWELLTGKKLVATDRHGPRRWAPFSCAC